MMKHFLNRALSYRHRENGHPSYTLAFYCPGKCAYRRVTHELLLVENKKLFQLIKFLFESYFKSTVYTEEKQSDPVMKCAAPSATGGVDQNKF